MGVVDKTGLWATRVTKLEEQVVAGDGRLEDTISTVSRLIMEEVSDAKIAVAKRDADAASRDLQHLRRALVDTRQALAAAREAQEADVLKERGARVGKLQRRRGKALENAEAAFSQFIKKLEESEGLATKIHQAAGGCSTVGEALNDRHGPMVTWMILKLLDVMPVAEAHVGSTIANHHMARQQIRDKTLADTQSDYAEMFKIHHTQKDQAA